VICGRIGSDFAHLFSPYFDHAPLLDLRIILTPSQRWLNRWSRLIQVKVATST